MQQNKKIEIVECNSMYKYKPLIRMPWGLRKHFCLRSVTITTNSSA